MDKKWFVHCDIKIQTPPFTLCSFVFGKKKKGVAFIHSTIQGTLPISRHFLFVDDAVKAFLLLLEKGTVGEIYNVGTTCEIPIIQLARELVKMVRRFKHDANVGLSADRDLLAQVKNVPDSEVTDWLEFVPDR